MDIATIIGWCSKHRCSGSANLAARPNDYVFWHSNRDHLNYIRVWWHAVGHDDAL